MKYPIITFMLIGLVGSLGIIIANNRGIIIDAVLTDMGTTVQAWELAFSVYILCFSLGIFVDMVSSKRKYFDLQSDYQGIIFTLLLFIISIFLLQATSQGSIAISEYSSMQTEFYNWYGYFTLAFIAYLINIFVQKR